MSRYPDLDQHCPIEGRIDAAMDGSFCRRCRTTVHDLDSLDEASRLRLIAGTQGDTCVRYRTRRPAALAAAALIAAGIGATPAAAQEATPPAGAAAAQQAAPAPQAIAPDDAFGETEIVGVMSRPTHAQRARWLREARRAERKAAAERRRAEKAARRPAP